ncbi:MAG: di-heme enzyme [Kofleriaceae bacterium]|nr:di-heme enzyme [Kofleriaceae bacterium]
MRAKAIAPAAPVATLCAFAAGLAACGDDAAGPADAGVIVDAAAADPDAAVPTWPFALPPGFPVPRLPASERLTAELAELGRFLFYEVRLSANETQACGSCHLQARAFTDGRVTSAGSTGVVLRRNAMGLVNVAYSPTLTWANPLLPSLEQQALVPIFGDNPIELGAAGHEDEILGRLSADPGYPARFAAAFPGEATPVTWPNVIRALAAFQRRLISGDSRVDRYRQGDLGALSAAELRGQEMFFSETFECHHCHGGFNFTIAADHAGLPEPPALFFNTGLYNVGGTGDYPAVDQGLWEITFAPADRGRYRPPSLRNVALTAPYMHDGSVATLDEVISIYERGGRDVPSGPFAGDGRLNPNKSPFVSGFTLTPDQRADLIAFLTALSDETLVDDPAVSDPFALAR